MNKGKDWHGDIPQHKLTGRGIPISYKAKSKVQQFHNVENSKVPSKEIYPIDWDVISRGYSKNEPSLKEQVEESKKVIMLFWWSSVNDNWNYFDIEKGITSLERLCENYIKWDLNIKDDEQFKKLINKNNNIRDVCRKNKVTYDDYMDEIVDYCRSLKKSDGLNHNEKVNLIDRGIHIQHTMGTLLGGEHISIPQLRNQFEEEYL